MTGALARGTKVPWLPFLQALQRTYARPAGSPGAPGAPTTSSSHSHGEEQIEESQISASVLCLVGEHAGQPWFVLEARPLHMSFPGQICFPGGRRDHPNEKLVDVALRETCEELGVRQAAPWHVEVAASMPPTFTRGRGKKEYVAPFVGTIQFPSVNPTGVTMDSSSNGSNGEADMEEAQTEKKSSSLPSPSSCPSSSPSSSSSSSAVVPHRGMFTYDTQEVADVICVSLSDLADGFQRDDTFWFKYGAISLPFAGPTFALPEHLVGHLPEKKIWGMTARVLMNLLDETLENVQTEAKQPQSPP